MNLKKYIAYEHNINSLIKKFRLKKQQYLKATETKEIYLLFGDTRDNALRSKLKSKHNEDKIFYQAEELATKKINLDLLRQEEVMVAITTNTSIDIVSMRYGALSEMSSLVFSPNSRNKIKIAYSENTCKSGTYLNEGPLKIMEKFHKENLYKFDTKNWKKLDSKKIIPKTRDIKKYYDFIIKKLNRPISNELQFQIKNEKAISMKAVIYIIFQYFKKIKRKNVDDIIKDIIYIIYEVGYRKILYVNSYYLWNYKYEEENTDWKKTETKNLIKFLLYILCVIEVLQEKNGTYYIHPNNINFFLKQDSSISKTLVSPTNFNNISDDLNMLENFKVVFNIDPKNLSTKLKKAFSKNYFEFSKHHNKKKKNIVRMHAGHKSILNFIQYFLNHHTNLNNKISNNSYAFQRGKSIIDNAKVHIGKKTIIKIDIRSFFPNTSFSKIENNLRKFLDLSNEEIKFIEVGAFHNNKLPIGWTTSPLLSEIAFIDIDKELEKIFKDYSWSRYADDITISSEKKLPINEALQLIDNTTNTLLRHSYEINTEKTRYYVLENNFITEYSLNNNQKNKKVESIKVMGLIVNSISKKPFKYPRATNRQYKKMTRLCNLISAGKPEKTVQRFNGLSNWLQQVNKKQYNFWSEQYLKNKK